MDDDFEQTVKRVEQLLQANYTNSEEFNKALNGEKPINLPSLRPGHNYDLEASEILFWTDRDAYNDELAFWETARTLETYQEPIDRLKAENQQSVFSDLVGAIKRARVAPFIGAGMSFPCKLPLWGEALNLIAERIDGIDKPVVQECIAKFDYLQAAQILWTRTLIRLRTLYAIDSPRVRSKME